MPISWKFLDVHVCMPDFGGHGLLVSSSSDSSQPPLKRFKRLARGAADTRSRAIVSSTHRTTVESELRACCSEANSYTQTCEIRCCVQQQLSKVSTSCSCGARPSVCTCVTGLCWKNVFCVWRWHNCRKGWARIYKMYVFLKVNEKHYV